jgi:hypothetical protein
VLIFRFHNTCCGAVALVKCQKYYVSFSTLLHGYPFFALGKNIRKFLWGIFLGYYFRKNYPLWGGISTMGTSAFSVEKRNIFFSNSRPLPLYKGLTDCIIKNFNYTIKVIRNLIYNHLNNYTNGCPLCNLLAFI